jgi:hypothetical protein
MLRQQSSDGAGDWDVFAGVLGGERPDAHPADRGAAQTWLIGLTPSASGSGKLLHAAYVPVVAKPRTLDRQSSGGGWSRPAYQPERSFRQAPPPVEEPNVHAWMADMRLRQRKFREPLRHRLKRAALAAAVVREASASAEAGRERRRLAAEIGGDAVGDDTAQAADGACAAGVGAVCVSTAGARSAGTIAAHANP